jgi:Cu(I)/Ag(I) efflux system membrane fusion protein
MKFKIVFLIVGLMFSSCTKNQTPDSSEVNKSEASTTDAPSEKVVNEDFKKKVQHYTCAMHPQIITDKPGQCPICHMDLIPLEEPAAQNQTGKDSGVENQAVKGRASFELSNEKQQLIGIAVSKITKEDFSKVIHATGKVAYDPELYTAFEEYRQAVLSYDSMNEESLPSMRANAKLTVESAKTKLKLMGLSDSKIKGLLSNKNESMNFVLPKGKAWIYTEVFEYELSGVKVGQSIEATAPSITDEVYKGVVSSINPILNSASRTVRVKSEVNDPREKLRPDTFVNVSIVINYGKKLVVPEEAVLFSMGKSFVFIEKEKGKYEPVMIEIGEKGTHKYEVKASLC